MMPSEKAVFAKNASMNIKNLSTRTKNPHDLKIFGV
jgi:hypothetical protein